MRIFIKLLIALASLSLFGLEGQLLCRSLRLGRSRSG